MAATAFGDKVRRLLGDGNVHVLSADERHISARVRGDSGVHDVAWAHGGWSCTCPTFGPRCTHIEAVRRITMQAGRGL